MLKWIPLFLFSFSLAQAQLPQGKLYVHTYPTTGRTTGDLGYIDYGTLQYTGFDSLDITEMVHLQGRLYMSEAFRFNEQTSIRIYDTQTHSLIDSIADVSPNQLATWKNRLVFGSYVQPGFRVYDLGAGTLAFSLDSSKVPDPLDILVSGDSAYISSGNTVTVVDLNLQDTVATIALSSPFAFVGYSQWLAEAHGKVYVSMEYATGAPRFSLFRIDKQTLTATSVRYIEFESNPYPFVVAAERLYFAGFDSHYDIPADSLYLAPSHDRVARAYDAANQVLMVHDQLGKRVETWHQDSISGAIDVPQIVDASLFVAGKSSTAIDGYKPRPALFRLFPNPAREAIYVRFLAPGVRSLRVINGTGRVVWRNEDAAQASGECRIPIDHLSPGTYYVEARSDAGAYSASFVRRAN